MAGNTSLGLSFFIDSPSVNVHLADLSANNFLKFIISKSVNFLKNLHVAKAFDGKRFAIIHKGIDAET